jgi:hypothetical protein
MFTVALPLAPCCTLRVAGVTVSATSGAAVTATVKTVVVFCTPVAEPVTVAVYEPGATVPATCTVTVAVVVVPLSEVGETDTIMLAGSPATAKATVPLNPPPRTSVRVIRSEAPCWIVTDIGAAVSSMDGLGPAELLVSLSQARTAGPIKIRAHQRHHRQVVRRIFPSLRSPAADRNPLQT